MAITINGDTGISSIGALSGVTSVSSASADTPVILQDSSSNSATCRAWVNFNGTGTVAIRADFNVTSITDNGTGDYLVNFTTAMPDENYATVATAASAGNITVIRSGTVTYSTTSAQVNCNVASTSSAIDPSRVTVAVFR